MPCGNEDLLADDGGVGQGQRDVLDVAAQPLVAALECIANGVEVVDVAVDYRVLGQGLDGIPLNPLQAFAGLGELNHLDCG